MIISKTKPCGVSPTWCILLCLDADRRKQSPFPWALAEMHVALGCLTDKQAEDVIAALTSAPSILGEALNILGQSETFRLPLDCEYFPALCPSGKAERVRRE